MNREEIAKVLFDRRPHNHPAGHIPRWKDQPSTIKASFYGDADAILALRASAAPEEGIADGLVTEIIEAFCRCPTTDEMRAAMKTILADRALSPDSRKAEPVAWPTDEQVWDCIRLTFSEKVGSALSFKRWKDGIDVDYPTPEAVLLAKQFFAMGMAAALAPATDGGREATWIENFEGTDIIDDGAYTGDPRLATPISPSPSVGTPEMGKDPMSTVEQIVDLIRAEHRSRVGGFAISTGEAIELIEQYAKVQAGAVVAALAPATGREKGAGR